MGLIAGFLTTKFQEEKTAYSYMRYFFQSFVLIDKHNFILFVDETSSYVNTPTNTTSKKT